MTRAHWLSGWRLSATLALAVGVSALALVLTGYRAVVEWQHAAALVAVRRAESAADLLVAALARDMRGAQLQVLAAAERDRSIPEPTADLLHPIASAFARYPYTEAFFGWGTAPAPDSVVFYTRAERRPSWLAGDDRRSLFPVVVGRAPAVAGALIERAMKDAWQTRRFSIFETEIAGSPYQVVTLLSYADALHERPAAALGFIVNLTWARTYYFADLAAQVAQIEGKDRSVQFLVLDDRGVRVAGRDTTSAALADAPQGRRVFPLAFFDPTAVAIDPPPDLPVASWTAVATARDDPTLGVAERGAHRTLIVASVMGLTLTVALVLSLQAARAVERLGEMRADFVSAVTHELKTPDRESARDQRDDRVGTRDNRDVARVRHDEHPRGEQAFAARRQPACLFSNHRRGRRVLVRARLRGGGRHADVAGIRREYRPRPVRGRRRDPRGSPAGPGRSDGPRADAEQPGRQRDTLFR
ncbi:MAG: hypothetical protein HY048_17905 [Acidobacteria bacterium]|nr:hypothetical protein [Acidobacteriota bacterium]